MNELTIGDKVYISSKRAAEITGYAKDYVGQLCREGHVEAKMVGRSWYVLETSIKEHRFGTATKETSLENESTTDEKALDMPASASPVVEEPVWKVATYAAEAPEELPQLITETPKAVELPESETLSDMQTAWQEWFSKKQELRIESPEIIDAREMESKEEVAVAPVVPTSYMEQDSREEPVLVHKIQTETREVPYEAVKETEEPVSIRRFESPKNISSDASADTTRKHVPLKKSTGHSNLVIKAILWIVVLATVSLTLFSLGIIGSQVSNTTENSFIQFLAGTSIIK